MATNVALDTKTCRAAKTLFAGLGLDLPTAINVFLRRSLAVKGLPFPVSAEGISAESANVNSAISAAYSEAVKIEKDIVSGKRPRKMLRQALKELHELA